MKIKTISVIVAALMLLTGCPSASDTFYYPYQGTYRLTSLTKSNDAPDMLFATDSYIEIYYTEEDVNPLVNEEPKIGIMSCPTEYNYIVTAFFNCSFETLAISRVTTIEFDFFIGDDSYSVTTDSISSNGEFGDSLKMFINNNLYALTFTLDKTVAYSAPQK